MKDPIYQLSGIFLLVMQGLTALFGAFFLVLGFLAFNGLDIFNFILKIIDEPHPIHSDQIWMTGFLFLGQGLFCLIAFVVISYLKKVIQKEIA